MFRGAAHWICKLHPRARDHVFFCTYEGVEASGSGAAWDKKAKGFAARGPKRDPVERMFQAATAAQMSYDMHVRAWSWFDVFTQEEREPFVKFIQQLRDATEARVAAGANPESWRLRGPRREVSG